MWKCINIYLAHQSSLVGKVQNYLYVRYVSGNNSKTSSISKYLPANNTYVILLTDFTYPSHPTAVPVL